MRGRYGKAERAVLGVQVLRERAKGERGCFKKLPSMILLSTGLFVSVWISKKVLTLLFQELKTTIFKGGNSQLDFCRI